MSERPTAHARARSVGRPSPRHRLPPCRGAPQMASGARCGRACEGYERPGVAFGRGDDRSSSVWCVHALYAAPSLPHPRAREARSARSVVPLPRAPRHVYDRDDRSTRWPRDPSARADCVHQSRIARTRAYEPRGCPLHDGFSSARALLDRRACGRWRLARRARTCCQAPCSRTGRGPGPRVVMGARTNRSVASLLLHPAVRVASSVASLLLNPAVRVGALSCATSSAAHCNDSSPAQMSSGGHDS